MNLGLVLQSLASVSAAPITAAISAYQRALLARGRFIAPVALDRAARSLCGRRPSSRFRLSRSLIQKSGRRRTIKTTIRR
jgi:hypothetical protein